MRISNPIFSTEDFEITYIGFLIGEEFIGSLLEEFVKIYSVDDVARSINCLNPEMTWRLVLIKIVRAISARVLFLRSTTPFC